MKKICNKMIFPLTMAAVLLLLTSCGSTANSEPEPSLVPAATAEPTPEPEPTEVPQTDIPVDFDYWKSQNEDVYAYIEIPDSTISFPVLQHPTSDAYYLDHNIDGTGPRPGVIYSERWNGKDFTSFNTVLYGHDMNDFSMFGTLEYYRDQTYFDQHRTIWIYTPTEKKEYEIMAAVVTDDRYIPYHYNYFGTDKDKENYIEDIKSNHNINSVFAENLDELTSEDTLLTLSTCVSENSTGRYWVVARLIG